MTPLEKAKSNKGRVNYCDECEHFEIVGNACYCKVDGKLIHPIMLARGQGTGAAWNCKKRKKPITNYDRIIYKSPEELAEWLTLCLWGINREVPFLLDCNVDRWLDWLKKEADDGIL